MGESVTSSIDKKIPKLIGEEFTNEYLLHCLHRTMLKTKLEICKDEAIFVRSEDIQVKWLFLREEGIT